MTTFPHTDTDLKTVSSPFSLDNDKFQSIFRELEEEKFPKGFDFSD